MSLGVVESFCRGFNFQSTHKKKNTKVYFLKMHVLKMLVRKIQAAKQRFGKIWIHD